MRFLKIKFGIGNKVALGVHTKLPSFVFFTLSIAAFSYKDSNLYKDFRLRLMIQFNYSTQVQTAAINFNIAMVGYMDSIPLTCKQ